MFENIQAEINIDITHLGYGTYYNFYLDLPLTFCKLKSQIIMSREKQIP